jgi:putative redox protein
MYEATVMTEQHPPHPPNRVHVVWTGGQGFDAGRPGGPTVRIDGTGQTGPGPVDMVLNALASCTAIDVVEILAKRRTPVSSLAIDVTGTRFEGTPRRLVRIQLVYRIGGAGIERGHAERAIELALNKYCSVRDSLDPKIPIEWTLELER